MKFKPLPSLDRVRSLFLYEENTGFLIWRSRPIVDFVDRRAWKIWNTKHAGKGAGNMAAGYYSIAVDGISFRAHRLVWLLCKGECPSSEIDHINHNRSDNRIENLRMVERGDNAHNMSLNKRNKSGVPGVFWCKRDKCWYAFIRNKGPTKNLGAFADWFEAVCRRKSAENHANYHPNHGSPICA